VSGLPAHLLAATVDWCTVASLAEHAAQRANHAPHKAQAGAVHEACGPVAARALLLRRTLLARHLDSLRLDASPHWSLVGRLMVCLCGHCQCGLGQTDAAIQHTARAMCSLYSM
jgi:hypothetical protein